MSQLPAQFGRQRQANLASTPPFQVRASRPRLPCGRAVVCWLLLALGCVGALAGCGHSLPTSSSASEARGEQHEHNPPHKPRDFSSGLAALHKRFAQLFKTPNSQSLEEDKEFSKLVDIVGWIPELAADSDLNRAEWDRINEQSKELARDVEEFARPGSEKARPRIQQQIETELQALDDVVRRHPEMFGKPARVEGAAREQNVENIDHPRT
jgi:hypothetical protein